MKTSIILPVKNEAVSLDNLLKKLLSQQPDAEIIVVNDGSTDNTVQICNKYGITVISHPYSMGNGAAIKTGVRNASGQILVFMDADGQHDPADINKLLKKMDQNFDMVVGARQMDTHATFSRRIANTVFNKLASIMTGHEIKDLTSGFRAARARHFRKFLYLLPNKFSYPTTSTMAFFRSALPVGYVSIRAAKREGNSHIRAVRDGLRFFIIILKIGALFSPMRFFLPISLVLFLLGSGYYAYTFFEWGRLTNMTAILYMASLITFLIGILSEQISSLHYRHTSDDARRTDRRKEKSPVCTDND